MPEKDVPIAAPPAPKVNKAPEKKQSGRIQVDPDEDPLPLDTLLTMLAAGHVLTILAVGHIIASVMLGVVGILDDANRFGDGNPIVWFAFAGGAMLVAMAATCAAVLVKIYTRIRDGK